MKGRLRVMGGLDVAIVGAGIGGPTAAIALLWQRREEIFS
jgi:thioredoxin reductase